MYLSSFLMKPSCMSGAASSHQSSRISTISPSTITSASLLRSLVWCICESLQIKREVAFQMLCQLKFTFPDHVLQIHPSTRASHRITSGTSMRKCVPTALRKLPTRCVHSQKNPSLLQVPTNQDQLVMLLVPLLLDRPSVHNQPAHTASSQAIARLAMVL